MKNKTGWHYRLAAMLLAFAMMMSGASMLAFAEEDEEEYTPPKPTYTDLKLGTKKTVVIKKDSDDNLVDQFFKIKIPKKGKYKVYLYNSYHNEFNHDFWAGFYRSAADAEDMENIINCLTTYDYENPDPDMEIYNLNAGTYYIRFQAFNEKRVKAGIKIDKVTENDMWRFNIAGRHYAGQSDDYVEVCKDNFTGRTLATATITSVSSSNKGVVAVKKERYRGPKGKIFTDYSLIYKKAGKAKLTIKYKRPKDKKTYKLVQNIYVNKYPAQISSMKVCGKTVSTSKNKYDYTQKKYKGTSAVVKMKLKKGWHIADVYRDYYTKRSHADGREISKATVTKGTKISFPKKYNMMVLDIGMANDATGDYVRYRIEISR